jgi:formate hydrogenlyase subunit 3/multisubunit Na+/H+ antiporter MnhD subunit
MSGIEYILKASWLITFIVIIALFFVPSRFKAYMAIFVVLVNAVSSSYLAFPALKGNPLEIVLNAGSLFGNIPVRIDGLSAWFIFIINFTCITGVFYGTGYLKTYNDSGTKLNLHWILFVVFHLSMVWVCMLQHGFAFLVAWEIMSLSSMMLVIYDHNNTKTIKAGINYLVQMHISVAFLSVGFIWVYFQTGSFDFSSFQTFFNTNNNVILFLIFFVGFGIKAGFIPLHTWLPYAHPAAPSHISGVMSGVIVKLGIYGIFRIISFIKSDFLLLGEIVLSISMLTGIYGILNAAVHRDFKRMLAYCTIENIGIIGIGIGIGMIGIGNGSTALYYLGFGGALFHVLNHSLFKSLLFYSAGSVYQQTHSRNMDRLGGLIKSMPKTAMLFLIGALAIAGIPPFNGFVSEFIIYSGLIEGLKSNDIAQICLIVLSLAGISMIGGISILAFTKTFGTIFLGNPRTNLVHKPHEVSNLMLIPQYFIIAAMLSVSFLPFFYFNAINHVIDGMFQNIVAAQPAILVNISHNLISISIFSAVFIGIIAALWILRSFIVGSKENKTAPTWGCSYLAPNTKMQYTGKSFSKPLGKIFNFLIIEKKQFQELKPGETFPENRKYVSYYHDFFENRIIKKTIQRLLYFMNYFKFVQNGRMQWYVLYGIVFISTIFILTFLDIIK